MRQSVAEDLLDAVQACYLPHCRYLQRAEASFGQEAESSEGGVVASLYAECGIPRSCYIEDTGHFNAVEANICLNQMYYLLTAVGVQRGAYPELASMTLEEWFARQLPANLITDISFRFRRPIGARAFAAEFHFTRLRERGGLTFLSTRSAFSDTGGGAAQGEANFVIDRRMSLPEAEGPS